jgi:hypothetical protein
VDGTVGGPGYGDTMSNPQVEPTPEIPRLRPSYVGTESESLSDWLDFHIDGARGE